MSTAPIHGLASLFIFLLLVACASDDPVAPALPSFKTAEPPPSVLEAVAASQTRVDLTWRDNSSAETGFEIHRSTTGATGAFVLLARAAGTTGYSDVGLTASTQFCYRVRTYRTTGSKTSYSPFSNSACATTLAPPPPPPGPPNAPSWANLWPISSTTVGLSWTDNSVNEDGVRVERSLDAGASWLIAATFDAHTAEWFDSERTAEQPVCYRIIAFNSEGDSSPSATACRTPPAGPTNLTFDAQGDLIWTDNSAVEDGYEVWVDTYPTCPVQSWYQVASLPANSTRYTGGVPDVYPCVITAYYVVATKDGGASDWSNPAP